MRKGSKPFNQRINLSGQFLDGELAAGILLVPGAVEIPFSTCSVGGGAIARGLRVSRWRAQEWYNGDGVDELVQRDNNYGRSGVKRSVWVVADSIGPVLVGEARFGP